jgi:hypothetical protein
LNLVWQTHFQAITEAIRLAREETLMILQTL